MKNGCNILQNATLYKIFGFNGIAIKEATKKLYDVAYPGDSVNYSIPTSKTRRGRVGKGIANTLDTGCQQGVVVQEPLNTIKEGDAFCVNTGIHRYYFPSKVKKGEATLIKDIINEVRIRKLTPKECWRLQGFPDWSFERATEVNSDSQLYKQAGNCVTVNVIYEIAKRLS